jgi:hypothetical protein
MTIQVIALTAIAVIYSTIRYFNRTDIPKIKGIPEIPGIPIFGNLLQLGSNHAKVAQDWAKQYGPVFQVRMGNRVSFEPSNPYLPNPKPTAENCLRQHIRLSARTLDHEPIRPDIPPHPPHLPQDRLQLPRIHHRHLAMGRVLQTAAQSRRDGSQPPRRAVLHARHRPRIQRQYQGAARRQQVRPGRRRPDPVLPAICPKHLAGAELRHPHQRRQGRRIAAGDRRRRARGLELQEHKQ